MSKKAIVDLAEWSYIECRDYMQGILETGHLSGLDPDDETWNFVKKMEVAGWALETAEKCRNSAASMANKISGNAKLMIRKSTMVDKKSKKRKITSTQQTSAQIASAKKMDALLEGLFD